MNANNGHSTENRLNLEQLPLFHYEAEAASLSATTNSKSKEEWLFGWDTTPGIVSVWASRPGKALVWQRQPGKGDSQSQVVCQSVSYRPWLYATTLLDLTQSGTPLVEASYEEAARQNLPFSYQDLGGAPGSFRFLVSAASGIALEDAIIRGARLRLGQSITSLRDLDTDYYRMGPVEQYLMATGRNYYRGMTYSDLNRLQFDLETTGFDPKHHRIFMIAVHDSCGFSTVLEAPGADREAEKALIEELCRVVQERDPDVIENHNLFGFDLPFLTERARILGVKLLLGRTGVAAGNNNSNSNSKDGGTTTLASSTITRPSNNIGQQPGLELESYQENYSYRRSKRARYNLVGREMVDTLDAVLRHDFSARDMTGYGLKAAARYFGVAAPDRTYLPGAKIYQTYRENPELVRRYALDDVLEVDGLSRRLMGASFALAQLAPRPYGRIASAGPAMGILEPMLVRAYFRERVALPAYPKGSSELGPHSGGATILYSGGVARQVVKADVASMYPSIMRTYQVGPSSDRLGVLLFLVSRLTDLRLEHKQAARAVPAGSDEAYHHFAMHSAMKILINSGYGYMGAGSMALFSDRAAADEVTRHGREILEKVAEALSAKGLLLLEADTDGVYFAARREWGEVQERAAVAEVAAELPDGIRLEYEGRYQAMLCHEVKNYALLTYEDELILRGVAFRSSRLEPFGVRFLQKAVLATLKSDVVGLHQLYQQTVADLLSHRLPLEDVSHVAKLAKSPEQYAGSRKKMREAAYEALLATGVADWRTGERVRFYRATEGRSVLLPAKDNEGEAESEIEAGKPQLAQPQKLPAYDAAYYLKLLHISYVSRLRKAFSPEAFEQLFRPDGQAGLFDQPFEEIVPAWLNQD